MFVKIENIIVDINNILIVQDFGFDELLQKNVCRITLKSGEQYCVNLMVDEIFNLIDINK